ncbi:uncharacterized protein LOC120746843 [Simochromis diagramma]|uniref:uncharacterized protein LOC120746843 n=1 Tax=Simochromis diagramma TaxID=43689 RepID=UPI001A7E70F6|nr:uncharacterized protein LOC120746843 [Simochromis diagramma]
MKWIKQIQTGYQRYTWGTPKSEHHIQTVTDGKRNSNNQKALVGGFHSGAEECEGEASAEVTAEEQHHNNPVTLAEGWICVGHVEAEVVGANVENGDLREIQTEDQRPTNDCVRFVQSRAEINRLLEENRKLKSLLDKTEMNDNYLKGDTEKVKYYTGLTCVAIFMSVLDNVKAFLPASKKLSHFQMLLLTLMRLRLDLPVQHLCISIQCLPQNFVFCLC